MSAVHPAVAMLAVEADPAFVAKVEALMSAGATWIVDDNAGHGGDVYGLHVDGKCVVVLYGPEPGGYPHADFEYDSEVFA